MSHVGTRRGAWRMSHVACRHATWRVTIEQQPKKLLRHGLWNWGKRALWGRHARRYSRSTGRGDLARRGDGRACRGWRSGRGRQAVLISAPRALEKCSFFGGQRARTSAFDFGGHAQPVLSMREVAEGDESCPAIRRVGRALLERCVRDTRFAARKHLVRFDVAAFAVQISAALHVVGGPARGQEHETRRQTRSEHGVFKHLPRIRAPSAQS